MIDDTDRIRAMVHRLWSHTPDVRPNRNDLIARASRILARIDKTERSDEDRFDLPTMSRNDRPSASHRSAE
jgi:hypothetical protein